MMAIDTFIGQNVAAGSTAYRQFLFVQFGKNFFSFCIVLTKCKLLINSHCKQYTLKCLLFCCFTHLCVIKCSFFASVFSVSFSLIQFIKYCVKTTVCMSVVVPCKAANTNNINNLLFSIISYILNIYIQFTFGYKFIQTAKKLRNMAPYCIEQSRRH